MMITTRSATLIVVLALTGAALCLAADLEPREVRLLPEAATSREDLTLADVAELGPDVPRPVRELSLGRAPWPGHVREISRVLVKVRLVSGGFSTRDFVFSGAECCAVRLNSVRVKAERMVEAARSHLESCFPEGGPEVRLELLRSVQPVLLPAEDAEVQLKPSTAGSGSPSGMVRVDVDLVRGGKRLKRVPVSFMVRLYDRVAVARRRIGRGERLSPENIVFARREVTSVQGRCLRIRGELEGLQALRTIEPGTVVTRHAAGAIPKPVVVERNQRIFLVVQTRTLRVITLGKSLSRARAGEPVRAENLATGREVAGVATEQGLVRVSLTGAGDE